MTVQELIEELSDMPPEAEVRIMEQPSYPFENDIKGLWESSKESPECPHGDRCNDECECHDWADDHFHPHGNPAGGAVYILEGAQLGYGTKQAWEN